MSGKGRAFRPPSPGRGVQRAVIPPGAKPLSPPKPLPTRRPPPPPVTRQQRINQAGIQAGKKRPGNTRTNKQRQENIKKARNKAASRANNPNPNPSGSKPRPGSGSGSGTPGAMDTSGPSGYGTTASGASGYGSPGAMGTSGAMDTSGPSGYGTTASGASGYGSPGAMGSSSYPSGASGYGSPGAMGSSSYPSGAMGTAHGIEPLLGRIAFALEQIVQRGGKRLFTLRKRKTRRRKTRGRR